MRYGLISCLMFFAFSFSAGLAAAQTGSASAPAASEAAPSPASSSSYFTFDQSMLAYKSSTGLNRKHAADAMQAALMGLTAKEHAMPEWLARKDDYWGLMKDADPEIARMVMVDSLGVRGTSAARVRLLLDIARQRANPLRGGAMDALTEEIMNWRGVDASSPVPQTAVPGLEEDLRGLAFDPDLRVSIPANNLWAALYPADRFPMYPIRSQFALLALVPASFTLITILLIVRGFFRRRNLELEFASPGPTIEQAASMGTGIGYLIGLLAIGALLMQAWVIRGRAVGMAAADLVQAVSLVNVAVAAIMIITRSSNILSGKRAELRAMVLCCLLEALMGAAIVTWMALAFYDAHYLGGHPGPEILLAAGGSLGLAAAGLLVAALVGAASRTALEHRKS